MAINERCAMCGENAEGNYAIHRDGFGEGPEVPLCDECGSFSTPTCEEIWEKLLNRPDVIINGRHMHMRIPIKEIIE